MAKFDIKEHDKRMREIVNPKPRVSSLQKLKEAARRARRV